MTARCSMHSRRPSRWAVCPNESCNDRRVRYDHSGRGRGRLRLANRLSARSATRVLLLEAGRDTPPGNEPADVLDSYPRSYYNDAYFWPGLKVHWRRKENSPLVSFL